MQEAISIIVFIALLLGSHFLLKRVKQPVRNYLRLIMSIALIVLAWWPDGNLKIYMSVLLTILALSGILTESFALRKFYSNRLEAKN